ncbi:MAG: metallophosphoesterase [Chloroflexota bacterium]
MNITRRQFLSKLSTTVATGGFVALGYSVVIEPHWLEFPVVNMPIKNLPSHLEGKTLVQISDVHIGKRVDNDYILESFKQTQALNPDFVVYTGDFVAFDDKSYDQLKVMMPQGPKGKLGTVAILGNHDYGHAWREVDVADNITAILEDSGIRTLLNEVEDFSGLKIGGMEDFWSPRFFPEKVTKNIQAEDAAIVLCHNPDGVDQEGWGDYQGWVLSGHTHGGQCKPPFLPPPVLPVRNYRYSAGLIDLEDGRMLYINRGLGHLFRLRFNVRPEITVFKLSAAA